MVHPFYLGNCHNMLRPFQCQMIPIKSVNFTAVKTLYHIENDIVIKI